MDGKVAELQPDGTVGQLELVRTLRDGLESHYDWLWTMQRALVCSDDTGTIVRCRLDEWLSAAHRLPPEACTVAALVAERHRAMHVTAAELLARAHASGRVIVPLYDAFLKARKDFSDAAVQLERALWNRACLLDALTGLRNRHGMLEDLREEQQRALRDGTSCTLAMMDIDHFKAINDGLGHSGGDAVLRAAARLVKRCLRPYDRIYRYGGEEFLLCLPDTDPVQAAAIIERLREEIAARYMRAGHAQVRVTASFGLAPLDLHRPVEESLARADAALYRAKAQGRNRVVGD